MNLGAVILRLERYFTKMIFREYNLLLTKFKNHLLSQRLMVKISVIGAGNLGSSIAYEIVLIDILQDLAEGQAADIQQALPFKNKTQIYSGNYEKVGGSDIIILTAGKPRTPDIKDRLQLAEINIKIVKFIIQEIKKYSSQSVIITLTNPMDIINHFIYKNGF